MLRAYNAVLDGSMSGESLNPVVQGNSAIHLFDEAKIHIISEKLSPLGDFFHVISLLGYIVQLDVRWVLFCGGLR